MSFFTFSGNKLAMTVLAAGALAVGGTGVAAMAESLPDGPTVVAGTESPSPAPTETESSSPSPTATETESPDPTSTETEAPEPAPTETETEAPDPAPTETADPAPTSTAAGPDATGPAAFGLCTAFANGGLGTSSTAYTALVRAAGSEDGVGSYCATVTGPTGQADNGSAGPAAPEQHQAQQQQVKEQGQETGAANGGAEHQSNPGTRHSGGGQR
ncbi:protein tyrosine phosphatase [Arthrobacter sp. SLBN-53]|uniref:protein tyrosine phosphatase n=1 Tax=unclassified Pseudarthrobacter TaxID=2647000 RepID=UPI001151AD0B